MTTTDNPTIPSQTVPTGLPATVPASAPTPQPEPTLMVTFGPSITRPEDLEPLPLQNLMVQMQSGQWRKPIEAIRREANPTLQRQLKQRLPYFVFAEFDGKREDANVTRVHGVVFDFDHVPDLPGLRRKIADSVPWARYIFRSPVDGLKVVIPFARPVTDPYEYSRVWQHLRRELTARCETAPDNTPDRSRACFVSYDEDFSALAGRTPFDPDSVPDVAEPLPRGAKPAAAMVPQRYYAPNLTEAYVRSAVKYLRTKKLSWHDWSHCGMAFYNHFGEAGLTYWLEFADNPNYEDTAADLAKDWEGLKKYPDVKIGSFFHVAEQAGWTFALPDPVSVGEPDLNDYPELLELFGRQRSVPLDRDRLPAALNRYLDLVDNITDAQDGAKLTALLPVVACCIGNRVYMYNAGTRHYCNIWAAIIGPSTVSRKTTVINQAMKMLKPHQDSLASLSAKERNERDPELCRVTQARLYNLLAVDPNRLILQMELSAWMQEMNKSYNAGMKQEITDMFDGKDRSIAKMEIDEHIRKPAFSIVGATTEDWFYRELREVADQRGGFLQRFIICVIQNIDVNKLRLSSNASPEWDRELYAYDEILSVFRSLPGSHRLNAADDALALRDGIYADLMKRIALSADDPQAAYCARIFDNYFWRFCTLIHLLKYWQDLREARDAERLPHWFAANPVEIETAREAWYLCEYYFQNTSPFLRALAEGSRLDSERKVIRILQEAPGNEMTHSRLLCKSKMGSRDFRVCMDSLIEKQGVLFEETTGYNNRLARKYRINPVLINL